jgi:hypothetical protein
MADRGRDRGQRGREAAGPAGALRRAGLLACGALGIGLLGAAGPAAADADHVRSYHWHLRGPKDASPFESYQRYRERLGPHSGYADGEDGYQGHRERYGPAPPYTYYRPFWQLRLGEGREEAGAAGLAPPEPPALPDLPPLERPAVALPAGEDLLLERWERPPAPPLLDVEAEKRALLEESGWTPLNEGRLPEALARLSRLAAAQPELPVPSAGLAVAAAELGDRRRSLEAMRRALTHLPRGLRAAPVDERLRPRLARLAESEARAEGDDAAFLAASFHYLAGDLEAAREAVARIPRRPDEPVSTRQLRALLEEPARR